VVGAAIAGLVFRGFAEPASAVTGPAADGSAFDDEDADDVEDYDDEDADGVVEPAAAPAKAVPEAPDSNDEAQEFFDGKRG
jgi:aquaporin Z